MVSKIFKGQIEIHTRLKVTCCCLKIFSAISYIAIGNLSKCRYLLKAALWLSVITSLLKFSNLAREISFRLRDFLRSTFFLNSGIFLNTHCFPLLIGKNHTFLRREKIHANIEYHKISAIFWRNMLISRKREPKNLLIDVKNRGYVGEKVWKWVACPKFLRSTY